MNENNKFVNSYQYEWSNIQQISELPLNLNAAEPKKIEISMPVLTCKGMYVGGQRDLFEMNVKTTVSRIEVKTNVNGETQPVEVGNEEIVATFNSGPETISDKNDDVYYARSGKAYLRLISKTAKHQDNVNPQPAWSKWYTTSGIVSQVQNGNSKTISFEIPALSLRDMENEKGYKYVIKCIANPTTAEAMITKFSAYFDGATKEVVLVYPPGTRDWIHIWGVSATAETASAESVSIMATFYQSNMTQIVDGGPFLTKGEKYSVYELLRKALLTIDTHTIDNNTTGLDEYDNLGHPQQSLEFPIVLDSDTELNNRLKDAKVNETIFEGKNLWEILLQAGYYIHAIPYLEFMDDGTDRFKLLFKQLGNTKIEPDNSTKITVFNSRNLSEYFSQYDSYVTNIYSPQNVIEEWVVVNTSDPSYLVQNDNAELHLTYGITEILDFDIYMKLPNGEWDKPHSALENVFEKSIYDILSNGDPYKIYPTKGASLYYVLGDNKIKGLYFVPPSKNPGDFPMALKRILQIIWQGTVIADTKNMKFNDLQFHVKYRTQDSARITQVRPDIHKFMKNSSCEKYPHHEQFYGQQDKIVDSERFSANLWGKLIRVGNNVFQRQEYADIGSERVSGELVELNGEAYETYYVTAIENEYYQDAVFQKVTYSKNFNQISNIVTIPSEPRFYEVSERSKIRREVRMMDFFILTTKQNAENKAPRFLNNATWQTFIKNLLFSTNKVILPNYAWTRFKADKMRTHWQHGIGGTEINVNKLFPSSIPDRSGAVVAADDHTDCIVPLLHFPLHDGIMFEWDMEDNFKVSDFVDEHINYEQIENDKAYLPMQPLRYVDVKGRADLFSFKLFNKADWSFEQSQKLPQSVIQIPDSDCVAGVWGGENMGIALDKDCREELSFNYQINLLHDDNFVTFPNLFGQKDSTLKKDSALKMCLLSEEQGMFDEKIDFSKSVFDNVEFIQKDNNNAIEIKITQPDNIDVSKVKAVVLYQGNETEGRYAYIVNNVGKLPPERKLQSWWIYPVYND